MSSKMRSIRLQLDKIAEDIKKFDFLPSSVSSTEQTNNEKGRETYIGARDYVQMVGREKEKKHILKLLQNNGDRESSIIPIVDLGGMGKTTIAKFVYTLKETNEFHFDLKAWVYVSMDFKLQKVIVDIISQLDGRIPAEDTTLQHLKSQLDHILYGKIYLIVLDDLWEERVHTLEELVDMLQSGKEGSKIVVKLLVV
jgi:Cdc6-like AAA superfamily ATPase